MSLPRGTDELLCDVPWHHAHGTFTTITVN